MELKGTFYNKPLYLGNRPNLFQNFYENSAHNANLDVRAECAQRNIGRYILVTGCYLFALPSMKRHWHKSRKIVQ